MRMLLELYVCCSFAHVVCRFVDTSLSGQQLSMSVEEALTGWWPTLGHMASDMLTLLSL